MIPSSSCEAGNRARLPRRSGARAHSHVTSRTQSVARAHTQGVTGRFRRPVRGSTPRGTAGEGGAAGRKAAAIDGAAIRARRPARHRPDREAGPADGAAGLMRGPAGRGGCGAARWAPAQQPAAPLTWCRCRGRPRRRCRRPAAAEERGQGGEGGLVQGRRAGEAGWRRGGSVRAQVRGGIEGRIGRAPAVCRWVFRDQHLF